MKEKEFRLVSLSLALGHLRDFSLVERNGGYGLLKKCPKRLQAFSTEAETPSKVFG